MVPSRLLDLAPAHGRIDLRAAVLRLGGLLGWNPSEIVQFTETLTGHGWHNCDAEDLQLVLDEYLALGRVIRDKGTRRTARANDRSGE